MTEAAPWILLRGLTREGRHWGRFPSLLEAALPGSTVLTPDLPGNGREWQAASPASVEAMAEACREQLRRRGVAPPYRLLAMSLGAMVAVAWAVRYPHELQAAVLVNTSLRPFSPFWRRLRPRNYATLLRLAVGADPRLRELTILRLTANHPPAAAALLSDWVAWRLECPVSGLNAWRQLWAAARFRAPLQAPAVPLLLVASARDQLVDPHCSRQLAAAWRLPLVLHPSAGHDLPLDAAAWLATETARWLAAAPQSRTASTSPVPSP